MKKNHGPIAIGKSAKTGKIGDGKIFIIPLEEAVASAPTNEAKSPSEIALEIATGRCS